LVFVAGDDGKVRAIDSASGDLRWQFATAGPIKFTPSISAGRAYFGSADGHAYCVEAATGRLLWRFRGAPVERHIMVYDHLSSTWPVASGVLVDNGVAYFAAGIIDQDGTYVYAVEATSGKLIWQNNSSGHLNPELRKGVSVQGNLSILGNQLLLAGGNQVCPAQFDLKTGKCLSTHKGPGRPVANNGSFVGVFQGTSTIVGGRTLYSAADNVSTKGSFAAFSKKAAFRFNYGGIPPAWNDDVTTFVNFKHGKLTCCETDKVSQRIETGLGDAPANDRRRRWQNLATALQQDKAIRWQTDLNQPNKFEAISLVVCRNAIVAVVRYQQRNRAHPQWYLAAFDNTNGNPLFQRELRSDPLPGGLLVDRSGQMVVTMLNGDLVCFGE